MLLCAYRHRFHCSLMSIHVFVKHDVIHCLFILCLFCYIFHMLFYNKFKRQTNRTVSCLSSVGLEGHTSQGNVRLMVLCFSTVSVREKDFHTKMLPLVNIWFTVGHEVLAKISSVVWSHTNTHILRTHVQAEHVKDIIIIIFAVKNFDVGIICW